MKTKQDKIEEAKNLLKKNGYYVDNLWHVDDVKQVVKCGNKRAQRILHEALTNEATFDQIWFSIKDLAPLVK